MKKILIALVVGQLVGLLGWIDPLFIPLVLAGPVVVGGVAASRGEELGPVAALWLSAGLNMLWTDWVVNREDVVFHLVVAVVMTAIAAGSFGLVRLASRHRRRTA